MNSDSLTTHKNQDPTPPSYEEFKTEFYANLKKLEESSWTDFNTHDPGVTILDMLFYALTDLIYRTGFDIQDILASYPEVSSEIPSRRPLPFCFGVPEKFNSHFPEFEEVLPGTPITVFDYRKTMLDLVYKAAFDKKPGQKPGIPEFVVRNIWFEKALESEKDIFNIGQVLNTILEYVLHQDWTGLSEYLHPGKKNPFKFPLLKLNGLYEIVVELPPIIICEKASLPEKVTDSSDLLPCDWYSISGNSFRVHIRPDDNPGNMENDVFYSVEVTHPYFDELQGLYKWKKPVVDVTLVGDQLEWLLFNLESPAQNDLDNLNNEGISAHLITEFANKNIDLPDVVVTVITVGSEWKVTTSENAIFNLNFFNDTLSIYIETIDQPIPQYLFEGALTVQFEGGDSETIKIRVEILGLCKTYTKALIGKTPDLGPLIPEGIITAIKDLLKNQTPLYLVDKMSAVLKALKELKGHYQARRNLCEDFVRFKAARVEEIAVSGVFAIEEGADEEAVLADLYFQLDQFISPPVKFSNYEQMEDPNREENINRPFDEIFEGPLLVHGFIEDSELEKSDNVKAIYMSDLVNIIMDVEGIAWVDDFSLSSFINLIKIKTREKNYLELSNPKLYKPKFTIEKSNVRVKKGVRKFHGIYDVNIMRIYTLIEEKKQIERNHRDPIKLKDEKYVGLPQTPEGSKLDLMDYTSIQSEFPLVYGIGAHGLQNSASNERKAQARQLKGYLFIIEQILGNFLSQIAHTKALFSYRYDVPEINHTYFWKMLSEIPRWEEFISGSSTIPTSDGSLPAPATSPRPEDKYKDVLERIIENDDAFISRKGVFLDHLMARFGENLNEFQALLDKFIRDEGKDPEQFFIQRKTFYLQALPQLAANRPRAFNYCQKTADGSPDVWDTDNTSFLAKRLCHKLGLENCCRRDLVVCEDRDPPGKHSGKLGSGKKIIKQPMKKQSLRYGPRMKDLVYKTRAKIKVAPTKFAKKNIPIPPLIQALNKEVPILPLKNYTVPDCLKALEGFYMIEHILLRPKFENSGHSLNFNNPLVIWNYEGVIANAESFKLEKLRFIEDPYSFHMTFIFPKAEGKFSDVEYQHYVDRTIRNELPSHIIPHIFWLDKRFVRTFQKLYRAWLLNLCVNPFLEDESIETIEKARSTRNSLVSFLMFIWILESLDPTISPFE